MTSRPANGFCGRCEIFEGLLWLVGVDRPTGGADIDLERIRIELQGALVIFPRFLIISPRGEDARLGGMGVGDVGIELQRPFGRL